MNWVLFSFVLFCFACLSFVGSPCLEEIQSLSITLYFITLHPSFVV